MKRIRFQDREWLLVGTTHGAIATPEAYANGEASYAHLGRDGVVRRFHEVIGTVSDIEFLGDTETPQQSPDWLANLFTDPSWDGSQRQ
jgi:hypothetical protein